jgi:putative CocE/NonD family hydrolase
MNFEPCFQPPDSPALLPEQDGIRLERDVPIPMRDGVRLAADLYFPREPGPHPVLLERTPYGKHSSVMVRIDAPRNLARSGYVVAVQDVRGRYASEGAWYPFADDLAGGTRDAYDTIEWLAAQSFCTGKVGVFGGSYCGFNQYTIAREMPPHLAATFPRQGPQCLHTEWVYRGGALEFAFIVPRYGRHMSVETLRNRQVQFARRFREPQLDLENRWPLPDHYLFSDPFQWVRDYVSRQEDEPYWRQWDVAPHWANFDRPSYHVASWFDIFLGGTLRNFRGMPRRGHKLIIGPWIHGAFMAQAPQGRITGEMDCGEIAQWDYTGTMSRWFDCWLKGANDGIRDEPAARYFVMGSNEWKQADDWPPPGIEYRRLFLHAGPAGLSWEPAEGDHHASFLHDPDDPVPSCGGNTLFNLSPLESSGAEAWEDLNAQAGSRDQRPIEPRCLTFTSATLDHDLEITGPVEAVIYLSSTAVDTDIVVRLCDVYPDGRSMLLCDGIQRARYRESPFRSALLEPGRIYEIRVDLWATGNRFRAGHRIRVVLNSSCFPRFDVNPGTGKSALESTARVKAENRVYLDRRRPSHILLPVSKEG